MRSVAPVHMEAPQQSPRTFILVFVLVLDLVSPLGVEGRARIIGRSPNDDQHNGLYVRHSRVAGSVGESVGPYRRA